MGDQAAFIQRGGNLIAVTAVVQLGQLGPVRARMLVMRGVQADVEQQRIEQALEIARIAQRRAASGTAIGVRVLQVIGGQQPVQAVQLRHDHEHQRLGRIQRQQPAHRPSQAPYCAMQ